MNTIELKKTGNFWIDNGIVGLYKVLHELQESEIEDIPAFTLSLTSNALSIALESAETSKENETDVLTILNAAKEVVVKQYLKSTGSGWIYKDEAFEVYRKKDFKMHLKPFFVGKTPTTEGALCIPDAKDTDVGNKGRRMNKQEYNAFIQFKEMYSPVIIDERKFPLMGKGFLNTPPKYDIGNLFKKEFLTEGRKQCAFSGQSYQLADTVTGMDYPFLTSERGELNFASFLKGKPSISAKYAFVGLFAFYNLNYQLNDNLKNYFVLYDSSLKALSGFLQTIQPAQQQIKNADYCSFETYIIGVQYEAESLFNFLISVYKQVSQKLKSDMRQEIYGKSVFTLTNDGNIFRHVQEYTSLDNLFTLFDAFNKHFDEKAYFEDFLNFIRRFNKRIKATEYDTTWRNRLCSDMLAFRSIHKVIEWFLGEVKMKEESGGIAYLDKLLAIYNTQTQLYMKPQMVEMCKSLGNRIGRYCRENDNKGILFSIRNAKNRSEFLYVLSETQFRTEVLYSEEFFKELPDNAQWEEYKSLVSIFAMNSFLYDPNKQQKQTNTPQ